MGIDGKDVCVMVWKILRFSTNTAWKYVKRYPVFSGVSSFMIILYTFLPWLFYFLLYTSPLIASALFYLRGSKIGDDSKVEETKTDRGLNSVSVTEKAELKHQRSVRRNARRKVEEVGKDWDSSQASEDERGKVILTTLYGEVPEKTSTQDLERLKRKRTLLVSEESFAESDLDNEGYVVVDDPLERVMSVGGETEVECSSSSSSSEDEEGEEEGKGSGDSKVVMAWTEDDQKNLMDLGTSEIERNKRLENLMSRRRSRRLFLLAAEKSLMDMEVPRICIGRNYFGLDKESYEIDGLVMPGSAPSVLLPRRNPFDLPYDPQEEKPNLTGDSFHQEFAEANPKDVFFCRHESFHHRVFPSRLQKDSKLTSSWRNDVEGEPSPLQGSSNQLPVMKERDLIREKGDDMEAGEVRIVTDSIRNDYSDSNTSLSPREREKDFNVSDQSEASVVFCKRNDNGGNSLAGVVPKSSGSTSLVTARQKYVEQFGYSSRKIHTQSIDSDLQVEVSDFGSPPSSVDGNDSSDEERSLFIHESETGKEMSFDGGEPEEESIASPEIEEAIKLEPVVSHHYEVLSKTTEELKKLPENSADEIKISYDSYEPEPSERTEEPSERTQQLTETDVNLPGNSEEAATSPTSVLPDKLLPVDQTRSEVLDHTPDDQLRNVDPPAESSHSQLDEHSEPTEEATVKTVCSDATRTIHEHQEGSKGTFSDESKSAENYESLSINPPAEELNNNQTDSGIN